MARRRASAPSPEDAEAARERSLRLLAVRSRSAAELRDRLRRAGFLPDVVEGVIADLARVGLVDDLEFARSWVASRQAAGGVGKQNLRWGLRRKGVANELIERVLSEAVDDETEAQQALALARRRLREGADDPKALARVRRLLVGRGFGFDIVEGVMRRISPQAEQ
jgi:regulatory protein